MTDSIHQGVKHGCCTQVIGAGRGFIAGGCDWALLKALTNKKVENPRHLNNYGDCHKAWDSLQLFTKDKIHSAHSEGWMPWICLGEVQQMQKSATNYEQGVRWEHLSVAAATSSYLHNKLAQSDKTSENVGLMIPLPPVYAGKLSVPAQSRFQESKDPLIKNVCHHHHPHLYILVVIR